MSQIKVHLLTSEQWARARDLRLASLRDSAIASYEKLGFIAMGDPQPSIRVANKFYIHMLRDAVI